MGITPDILTLSMADRIMASEALTELAVSSKLIRVQTCFWQNVLMNHRFEVLSRCPLHWPSTNLTCLSFYQSQYASFESSKPTLGRRTVTTGECIIPKNIEQLRVTQGQRNYTLTPATSSLAFP